MWSDSDLSVFPLQFSEELESVPKATISEGIKKKCKSPPMFSHQGSSQPRKKHLQLLQLHATTTMKIIIAFLALATLYTTVQSAVIQVPQAYLEDLRDIEMDEDGNRLTCFCDTQLLNNRRVLRFEKVYP